MSLADLIVERTVEVVTAGRSRIAVCAIHGASCEGWLKVELLRALTGALGDDDRVIPEWRNVDLAVSRGSERVLVQLKTFPTNYGRSGKPITNFVEGVVDDLRKLSAKRENAAAGLAVWMAYVVPDPVPHTWPGHLAKVEAAAARTLCATRISLWDKAFANLYVMEAR